MTTKNFKAAILATIATLTPVPYTCPVTGQKAFVKRFTVAEREKYATAVTSAPTGLANATAFTMIVCDAEGNLLFAKEDIAEIAKLPDDVVSEAIYAFNSKKSLSVGEAEKN